MSQTFYAVVANDLIYGTGETEQEAIQDSLQWRDHNTDVPEFGRYHRDGRLQLVKCTEEVVTWVRNHDETRPFTVFCDTLVMSVEA